MKVKAVLFDMDGVLIDSEVYYMDGTVKWMKSLGYNGPEEDIYKIIGTTMEGTYVILKQLLDDRISIERLTEINERYFTEHALDYKAILKTGVVDLLQYLKAHDIKTAVCSSSPLATIQKALHDSEIESYFDFVVSGEQFVESKPNPEIYLHASKVIGAEPDTCVVIEDSSFGVEAGYNAKMAVIAMYDPRFKHDHRKATVIVNDMTEVKKWIIAQTEK